MKAIKEVIILAIVFLYEALAKGIFMRLEYYPLNRLEMIKVGDREIKVEKNDNSKLNTIGFEGEIGDKVKISFMVSSKGLDTVGLCGVLYVGSTPFYTDKFIGWQRDSYDIFPSNFSINNTSLSAIGYSSTNENISNKTHTINFIIPKDLSYCSSYYTNGSTAVIFKDKESLNKNISIIDQLYPIVQEDTEIMIVNQSKAGHLHSVHQNKSTQMTKGVYYEYDTIDYSHDSLGKNIITYAIRSNKTSISNECTFTVISCYFSCENCTYDNNPSLKRHNCITCKKGFAKKKDVPDSIYDHSSNCFNITFPLAYFYYDSLADTFNKCYNLCVTCLKGGNDSQHNCLTCRETHLMDTSTNQCITKCDYWLNDSLGNKLCQPKCPSNLSYHINATGECVDKCPSEAPFVIRDNKKCVSTCPYYEIASLKTCVNSCTYPFVVSSVKNHCEKCTPPKLINKINTVCMTQEELVEDINGRIAYDLDNNVLLLYKNYPFWKKENSTFMLYGIEKNNESTIEYESQSGIDNYLYLSKVSLNECGEILKNLTQSNQFLIAKNDSIAKGQITNHVEIVVYDVNGSRVDVSKCNGQKISIATPILDNYSIMHKKMLNYSNNDIDLLNSSSLFFYDICLQSKNKALDKDMTITDRRMMYIAPDRFCNKGCDLNQSNHSLLYYQCSCSLKQTNISNNEQLTDDDDEVKVFSDLGRFSRFDFLFCYELLFTLEHLNHNAGFMVYTLGLAIEVVLFLYFIIVILPKFKTTLAEKKGVIKQNVSIHKSNSTIKNKSPAHAAMMNSNRLKNSKEPMNVNNDKVNLNDKPNAVIEEIEFKDIIHSDCELTELPFMDAYMHDKRDYKEIFVYTMHSFVLLYQSLCIKPEKRTKTLQLSLMIFCLLSDCFFNALLFSPKNISYEYYRKSRLGSLYHLARSITSCLISSILKLFMTYLTGYNPYRYVKIKADGVKENNDPQASVLAMKRYKISLIFYFLLQFILLGLFWYYTTAFCGVYSHNIQYNWLFTGIFTIITSVIISILFSGIISSMRFISLRYSYEWLYNSLCFVKYVY